jgi:hypothetical protein
MKQFKRTSLRTLLALAFVCAGAYGVARADKRDLRLVSAKAGGVNYVSGDVKVRRAASAEWVALTTEDDLQSGDTVRTGSASRVEVLLNPGSYFRAGSNTEFALASTDLNRMRVEVARGSAVIEATGYSSEMGIFIEVTTPGSVVKLIRSGVYRINVSAGGSTEVAVAKGRAVVDGTLVKGNRLARVTGAGVEVVKLDKKWRDDLDLWSRDRGKELARANDKINRRALRSALSGGTYDALFGRNDPFGLWYFNASANCYTFLPYGYGWRSPYGYFYGFGYWRPRPDQSGNWVPRDATFGNGGGYNPTPGGGGSTGGSKPDYTPRPAPSLPSPPPSTPSAKPMRSYEPSPRTKDQ